MGSRSAVAAHPHEVARAVIEIRSDRHLAKVFLGIGATDLARIHRAMATNIEVWMMNHAPCQGQA